MDTDQNIYEYRILNRKCYENIDSSIFFKHFHDFYELYVFVSGEGYYTIESNVYQLRPYDAFLIQPAQYHFLTLTNTTHYERILIWFSDKDVPSSLLDSFGNKNIYVNIKDKPILNNLFFGPYWDTFSTYSRSDLEILSQLKLKEFLIHLKNTDTLSSASEHVSINPIVKKALKYINENLSEDLNIKKIADAVFVSCSYLSHLFQNTCKISIMEYVRQKKILAAKELIKSGCTPTEVFKKYGFNNYSTFYRNFKKHYSVSPRLKN